MKHIFYIFAFLFISYACSVEPLEQAKEGGKIAFTGVQGSDEITTRSALAGFETHWVAGDKIGVYSPQASTTVPASTPAVNAPFTAAAGGKSALFTGDMYWGGGAHQFFAYYPWQSGAHDVKSVPVSLPQVQTQKAGNDVTHLGTLDFMIATPLANISSGASSDVKLRFNHLFTLLELRTTGSGSLSAIRLETSEDVRLAFSGATIDISQSRPDDGKPYAINYADASGKSVTLTLTSPVQLTDNDATTPALYMMINPVNLQGKQMAIIATIDGTDYRIDANGILFERGKKYRTVVDISKGEIDVRKIIPDPVFRAWLKENNYITVLNEETGEVEITPKGLEAKTFSINHPTARVGSFKGIKYFPQLTELYAISASVTKMEYEEMRNLEAIFFPDALTELDLSMFPALTYLGYSGRHLTTLDLSGAPRLTFLNCHAPNITTLDLSHTPKMAMLNVTESGLTSIDLSHCPSLGLLYISDTKIQSIDISKNKGLWLFYGRNSQLKELDISNNRQLIQLDFQNASLTDLSVWWEGGTTSVPRQFTEFIIPNQTQLKTKIVPPVHTFSFLDAGTDPDNRILECRITPEQYRQLTVFDGFYGELKYITASIYDMFNDDFDFIFYLLDKPFSNEIVDGLGFFGMNMLIRNTVQGIGADLFEDFSWGSDSKLKSAIYYPFYHAISNGPTLHELCHNWANYICPTFSPWGDDSNSHWGISNAGGQLGGFRHVRTVEQNSGGVPGKTLYQASYYPDKNPDGSFKSGFGWNANGGNTPPYSDIELYLMGLKSAQDLRAGNFKLDVYTGISIDDNAYNNGYFWATGITSYTIDDLIAANGPRIPDFATSQKSFKVLTVVLTEENATTHHYNDIIKDLAWFSGTAADNTYPDLNNFKKATGGLGELVTAGVKNSIKTTNDK